MVYYPNHHAADYHSAMRGKPGFNPKTWSEKILEDLSESKHDHEGAEPPYGMPDIPPSSHPLSVQWSRVATAHDSLSKPSASGMDRDPEFETQFAQHHTRLRDEAQRMSNFHAHLEANQAAAKPRESTNFGSYLDL